MGDCISPSTVRNFAVKDTNRIQGRIAQVVGQRSPYMNVLKGGKIENISDVVRSVVQEQAVVAGSLTAPRFVNDVEMCGVNGSEDRVGSTEYSYALQTFRGIGPRVCVKTSRTAFKDSYLRAQESLQKGILKLMNADIRSVLHLRSGIKFVCAAGYTFDNLVTGDSQDIDTLFLDTVPTSPVSFKALHRLGTMAREELIVDPFESKNGIYFKFIGSADTIENLRNELGVKEDLNNLTAGSFKLGEKSLTGYSFEGPYRGYAFGIDPQPLRATANEGGVLTLVEPEISVPTTTGVGARRNPDWALAPYEVSFLIADGSFERQTPIPTSGEATFKFSPQLYSGELEWTYFRDNDCNRFGDFGQHIYQIQRAYRPIRPHAVIPILSLRCQYDLGFSTCQTISSVSGL